MKALLPTLLLIASAATFATVPSSLLPQPSSLIPHPSSLNPQPSSLIPPLPSDSDTVATAAKDTVQAKKAPAEKKDDEYEKLMKKGGTKMEGLFQVRHIEDKWYFEVADSMVGRLFLLVTRYTSVPQGFGKFAGEEVNHSAIYLEQRDEKTLLCRQYVLSHLADEKDNIAITLEKSTIDPIVEAFKVIGRDKQTGLQLIDVTPLFKQDNNLTGFSSTTKTTLKLGGLQSDRTFIDTMKVFPANIEVATTRTYGTNPATSAASRTGSITLGLNTSLVLLPKEPMRKRLWDERVGYFVSTFRLFSDNQRQARHEAFISRYKLVPKNKKKYLRGELTEPVTPIIYYIDPATPEKWIPYLMQGIEDWNAAFEAAGFKNAIQARRWPKDRPDMSLDDARFSVVRYLPSETENAYGPRIVDPRSGQIIEAHICWYHNVMNLLTKWYMVQCGATDKRAQTMDFDDKLMGQLIRFVSSHEVGHTLGLRHNMGASFATPVEKLRDKQWVEKNGHTASIMDYARFNYVAQPEDNVSEKGLFPRIGDYDRWAIRWGYQWRPEFDDEYEEKQALQKETTDILSGKKPYSVVDGNLQRLWFGGEGRNEDARAQTEDLGDNSVKASEYGISNLRRILDSLPQWTRQDNDDYEDLRTMYVAVHEQFSRYLNHVMKNMATRYHNNLPGREPVEEVSADRERQAVAFFGQYVFDAPEWLYPKNIISKTGTDATLDNNQRQEFQLQRLMTAAMLNTLYNISTGNDKAYKVPDFLNDVFQQAFVPRQGASEWQQKARRQLQRAYVQNLNKLLNPTEAELKAVSGQRNYNSDALLYALQHLATVEQYCRQQSLSAADNSIEKLHYDDLLRQLRLIRERREKVVMT